MNLPAARYLDALIAGDLGRDEFEALSLSATVQWCREHVPYYREAWQGLPSPVSRSDLAAYPLLDPRLMQSYDQPLLADGVTTDFLVFSGGTTTGKHKFIHRCFDEYRHLARFRDWWYPQMGYGYSFGKRPADARLVVMDDEHGIRYIEPRRGPLLMMNLPLVLKSHFPVVEHVLRRFGAHSTDRRIVELRGTLHKIQLLTLYAAEQGWQPAEWCAVERVLTAGSFATERWRRLFFEVWAARSVQENGQTEFHQSYATECTSCGWYHFAPIVLAELVDRHDPSRQLDTGTGRLVMTHLVPTALRQVLVRYDTGDLVEKGGRCAVTRQPQYLPLGRLRDTIDLETSAGLVSLAPSHFVDAVDIPEAVFGIVDMMQCQNVTAMTDIGFPRFRTRLLTGRPGRTPVVLLEIELKKEPSATAANKLRTRVESKLLINHKLARELLNAGEFEISVRFAGADTLHDPILG